MARNIFDSVIHATVFVGIVKIASKDEVEFDSWSQLAKQLSMPKRHVLGSVGALRIASKLTHMTPYQRQVIDERANTHRIGLPKSVEASVFKQLRVAPLGYQTGEGAGLDVSTLASLEPFVRHGLVLVAPEPGSYGKTYVKYSLNP